MPLFHTVGILTHNLKYYTSFGRDCKFLDGGAIIYFMKKFRLHDKDMINQTLTMAWPSIVESFFTAAAGLIDSYMVSSMGANAVAAVGLTTQPKFLGLSLFFAINIAVSALIARRRGEKKQDRANAILISSILFVTIASIIISIVMVACSDPIMHLCGSNEDTHDMAVTYFKIIMGGMIFNCLQMVINSAQRGAGNTKITMRTNITSSIVNIVFNYLLINGHLGFPAMGIVGAALATVLGTVVACVMSILSIMRKDGFLWLQLIIKEKIKPDWESFKSIVHLGYSVFFEQVLMRIGFMLTAIMAADQGTAAMAAHQVGMNMMGLTFSFGDGIQAAAVALIGKSLGEGKPDKAKEFGSICKRMALCIALVLACVYYFGAEPMMKMFFKEPDIVAIGVSIMHVIILVVLFQVIQVVYMGCLRGAGDTLYTAIASMISVTIIRTVVSYLGGYVLGFGIVGIWMGVLADQISRFTFGSIRFKQGKWINIKI